MAKKPLPAAFQTSYLNSDSYPRNLVHRTIQTYPAVLDKIVERLDKSAADLFVPEGGSVHVPFRDLHLATGEEMDKQNIGSAAELTQWLNIDVVKSVVSTLSRDPKCRLIYIWGQHSRAHLQITRKMLTQILTFHQVMPAYLDFMLVFGEQSEQPDLRFSGFREQTNLAKSSQSLAIHSLGRSGRQFQICYNLKTVELKNADADDFRKDDWSIRQAAIHHQFDVVHGTTLWIITKGGLDLQQRFKELTGKDARAEDKSFDTVQECFRSSLSAHLLWSYWSTDDWRSYIRWLERAVSEESDLAVLGPRGAGHAHKYYRPWDVQSLQIWEEKANTAIMVLDSNIDVLQSLSKFYDRLRENKDFTFGASCSDDIEAFIAQINDMVHDFRTQIGRANDLVKIAKDRKELVIQHLQSQSTERMEILNLNMGKEAVVMRIVTIVTLIYLPATFVSTFFSTDVVKYQGQEGGGSSYSEAAMNRWLQVTIPLTFVTLVTAWVGKVLAERKLGEGEPLAQRSRNAPAPRAKLPAQTIPASQASAGWRFLSRQETSVTVLPLHTLQSKTQ